MVDELDVIVISNGEISSGEIFGYGDTITVKSGGTLDDAYIPSSAGSLTLEAGAILTDSITIGGSGSNTSRHAYFRLPAFMCSYSACSSTRLPRAVLMREASFFISFRVSALNM